MIKIKTSYFMAKSYKIRVSLDGGGGLIRIKMYNFLPNYFNITLGM